MAKRIAVLVSNDLNHDQRVLKTCATLEAEGWTPVLIGRQMPESKPLDVPFEARRLQLPFRRGAGFYAALQIGLLRALFRTDINAIWANDLDTLLPAFLVARAKRLPLVYDSHEYFTEAAGLTGRPLQRGVWLMVERAIFPGLKAVITVNEGIADAYHERYPRTRRSSLRRAQHASQAQRTDAIVNQLEGTPRRPGQCPAAHRAGRLPGQGPWRGASSQRPERATVLAPCRGWSGGRMGMGPQSSRKIQRPIGRFAQNAI